MEKIYKLRILGLIFLVSGCYSINFSQFEEKLILQGLDSDGLYFEVHTEMKNDSLYSVILNDNIGFGTLFINSMKNFKMTGCLSEECDLIIEISKDSISFMTPNFQSRLCNYKLYNSNEFLSSIELESRMYMFLGEKDFYIKKESTKMPIQHNF